MLDRIAAGRTDLVFDYVKTPADADAIDRDGVSLIQRCAYYGDVSALRFLMANGQSLTKLGANYDLNAAAFHGHWRLCEFLIESGADPNWSQPDTGETALHAAASKAISLAHENVARVLLAAGGDPNAATKPGVLTGAFMRDARTKGETPLHRAAAFASEGAIEAILKAGGRRDARDTDQDTPLSWASWHLRPSSILRKLCYGDFSLHPGAKWTGDHGAGLSGMDRHLIGRPKE